ncbi:GNAT family N-acetyltransferase [Sphingomonas sp.]|uniref:GNAT family N-acetyltransferase n=1 Tax=Sphingomonas sp. TaxID=28214 RepID=UPI001DE2114C|nr:GNAT family N-acetyltransferase [Sphingomonas sp.]MBX9795451.1 GNAT family N-acetyltransferase [Sphingomonas sp.]
MTAQQVAAARRHFKLMGGARVETDHAQIASDPGRPSVWDANLAFAKPGADPARFLAEVREQLAGADSLVVIADALTDPAIEAALALAGFAVCQQLIEMVAERIDLPAPPPPVSLIPVADDASRATFAALIEADFAEGRRTGAMDAATADGLMAQMLGRAGYYRIIMSGGVPQGYGMAMVCPGRLGLIENLFTLPAARGQGLMSAFIAAVTEDLRDAGCDAVFLDAHADQPPKQLYARLGFVPVAMARTWVMAD